MGDFFGRSRDEKISHWEWCPSSQRRLYFVDCNALIDAIRVTDEHFSQGSLDDSEVELWLERKVGSLARLFREDIC